MTVTYRYIVLNSTETFRPIKFVLFQFAIVTGLSLGTYIGGQILHSSPTASMAPFRSYYTNYSVYLAIDLISFFLVLALSPSNTEEESETDEELESKRKSHRSFLSLLIDLNNVRQTIRCFFSRRPGHGRLQVHLLYGILFLGVLLFFGNQDVFFQFTEKVYHWDPKEYSNYASISTLITTAFMTLATVFLVKRWHFNDNTLLLIALVSSFGGQLVMGTFTTPSAYLASLFIGSLSGFSSITIRNRISRLVPAEELGKIFALCQTVESVMPFIGSLIFSHLFSLTISTYPGLIYQFSASLVLLSMGIFIFERLYCQ